MTSKGYKQTELGLIPKDWEVKSIGELGKFCKGIGIRKDESQSGYIPCVRYGELYTKHNNYIKDYYSFISESIAKKSKKLKKGDILFAGSGETKEDIGKAVAFLDDFPVYAGGDIVIFTPTGVNSLFFGFLMNVPLVCLQKKSKSQGDAVVHITSRQIGKIQIPLPPLPEQKAIATALSDMDELIDNLESLIDKKKQIKQGVLQKLLQPKKGWGNYKIGDLGKVYGGLSGKSKADFEGGDFPYVSFMNVMSNPIINTDIFDYVKIGKGEYQNKVHRGDLIFNGSSETPEEVGMCSIIQKEVPNLYLNSFCFGFRLNNLKKFDGLFLTYFFRSSYGRELMYSMAQGATRYNLSKSNFLNLKLLLPDYETQVQVSDILSAIELELFELETKHSKYQEIKQGMMQNLLTGKIRLV